ncbi:MAG: ADP-forming succinate--CoA ligase subunit beta [Bacteroidales bacterium]|nr:ADP-forming succinate--CoA ligase subunit beta [Bacteroidales bacterium]
MNIHEYQGKKLLKAAAVNVPEGGMIDCAEQAETLAGMLQKKTGKNSWVIKAQIHAGGRSKGGGVRIAESLPQLRKHVTDMLGMQLVTHQTGPEGKKVRRLLIEENVYHASKNSVNEFYISIVLNRATARLNFMYSTEGGMDIEVVAERTPYLIHREEIHPGLGLQQFQARKIAFDLGLNGNAFKEMIRFLLNLYKAYVDLDASLIEINPLVRTSDERILALDAKIILDDNALIRHPDYEQLRDPDEEDDAETEALKSNLNFIKLRGNVGCMVNGAGLAMATMDIIKLSGGEPANFLDVGGTANARTVESGFRIILRDPDVKIILINIFGGIVRCDRVAQGVVDAFRSLKKVRVPVVVRLQGTNAEEAMEIIKQSGLDVHPALSLQDAGDLIKEFF